MRTMHINFIVVGMNKVRVELGFQSNNFFLVTERNKSDLRGKMLPSVKTKW